MAETDIRERDLAAKVYAETDAEDREQADHDYPFDLDADDAWA